MSKIDRKKDKKDIINDLKTAYDMFKRLEFPD